MRYAALLLFIGCSAGPSVDVPPPVVVEPVSDADKQNDPVADSVVAEKPASPLKERIEEWLDQHPDPAPDDDRTLDELIVDWLDESPAANSCECGDECRCVDCQCADCPHRAVKDSLTVRELTVIGAEWCGPCRVIHDEHGDTPGVRFVDIDRDRAEAIRLWGAMPARIPAFVLTIDGEPVQRWSASSHKPWIEGMRDFEVPANTRPSESKGAQPATGETALPLSKHTGVSSGVHDAKPQDAAKPGEPPAGCLRVRGVRGRQQYNASCVAVGRDLVLTNSHVVRDGNRLLDRYRVWIGGGWHDAAFVADDRAADLALLRVSGASLSPVALADRPPYGTVETHGYAFGSEYKPRRPVVSLTLTLEDGSVATAANRWFVQTRFEQGESGGAVTQDGRLVGLVHGNDNGGLAGIVVSLPSIRAFLSRQGVL